MNCVPPFTAERRLGDISAHVVDLHTAAEGRLRHMPVLHRILLENVVRCGGPDAEHARRALLGWLDTRASTVEIPFLPGRILMHDTTCGPALVDIAAMRAVIAEAGGDPMPPATLASRRRLDGPLRCRRRVGRQRRDAA